MIFVIIGTQDIQFNRLLQAVDRLVENAVIKDTVFAQTGYSDYQPQHYAYEPFMSMDQFARKIDDASLIISHGGAGTIVSAVKQGKIVIGVPRLSKYGEHVDDHQVELVDLFADKGYILTVREVDDLAATIAKAASFKAQPYISGNENIIKILDTFIDEYKRQS